MRSNKKYSTAKEHNKLKKIVIISFIVCLPFLFFGNPGMYIIALPTIFPIMGIIITIFEQIVGNTNKNTRVVYEDKAEDTLVSNNSKKIIPKKISLTLLIVLILGVSIYFGIIIFDKQNKNAIKLSGYYYENVEQDVSNRIAFYFEEDETCFIKQESITKKSSTIVLSENYSHCTYHIENDNMQIDVYDNNKYSNLLFSKEFKVKEIENGIMLNNVEFLNNNYENESILNENILEKYSYECATGVAKMYNIYKNCTSWKKISDGFYNYSCGATIRTYIDDIGISYDTYGASGIFTKKDYCYKIIKNVENPIDVSNEIITKTVPIKIILTGESSDEYKIESIKLNVEEVTIIGYKYRLDDIDDFPIYIDVNNSEVNKKVKIKIEKPVYLKKIDLNEILVDVRIGNKKTKEFIVNGTEIVVLKLNDGFRALAVEPLNQIKVKVIGTDNTLKELEDVELYIDLEEYTKIGIYDVDLRLNLDESIYDYVIEPSTIKIRID